MVFAQPVNIETHPLRRFYFFENLPEADAVSDRGASRPGDGLGEAGYTQFNSHRHRSTTGSGRVFQSSICQDPGTILRMVRFRRTPTGPGQVVDRRGSGIGSSPGMKVGGVGGGIGAILLVLFMLFSGGGNMAGLDDLGQMMNPAQPAGGSSPLDPANDPDADLVEFLGNVLQDSQTMWQQMFTEAGLTYREADMVVFSGRTQSGCGGAQAQFGPHYCPADENVYLDLDFLTELQRRFGAEGDAAQAYIVAHEVAHHIQHLLGILQASQQQGGNQAQINVELQADCFAGIWFHSVNAGESAAVLEEGDLEEALAAAEAVGDDNIQQQTTGRVSPESWTHGSSQERHDWLFRGFRTGSPAQCDTFG